MGSDGRTGSSTLPARTLTESALGYAASPPVRVAVDTVVTDEPNPARSIGAVVRAGRQPVADPGLGVDPDAAEGRRAGSGGGGLTWEMGFTTELATASPSRS